MYNLKYSLCPFNQYQELSPTNFTNTEKSIFVLYSSFAQNTNVSSIFKVTMGSMWNFCQCLKRAAKVKTCNNLLGLLAPYCVWRHTPPNVCTHHLLQIHKLMHSSLVLLGIGKDSQCPIPSRHMHHIRNLMTQSSTSKQHFQAPLHINQVRMTLKLIDRI